MGSMFNIIRLCLRLKIKNYGQVSNLTMDLIVKFAIFKFR